MDDLASWKSKHRELIFSCRVIGDRFGEAAVDAVAETHMKNIREAFDKKATETGRRDLAAITEGFEGITETHDHEIVHQDEHRLEIKVTRCAHAEMFAEWHATDIGLRFMCNGDLAMAAGLNPEIHLERPQLLMRGDSCCHFIYTLDA
jgi:hypothetical protein